MAVRSVIEHHFDPDGSVIFTETMAVSKRMTYRQRWPAYNAAQVNEKDRFQMLLRNRCETVPTPRRSGVASDGSGLGCDFLRDVQRLQYGFGAALHVGSAGNP